MNKRIYLITGPSGSGKSALAAHFEAAGHASIDTDSQQGISFFVNQNGKPVPYPQDANASWWDTHHYVWEIDRLKKLLDATNPTDGIVFVAGNAGNINKAWDIFEGVFYLDLPKDLMTTRMAAAGREASFGRRLEEQDQLHRWVEGFKHQMSGLGAITIDATKPLDKVAASIMDHIKKK
jgi:energy-coupling factor transporter ATP-binding protein EcfA2